MPWGAPTCCPRETWGCARAISVCGVGMLRPPRPSCANWPRPGAPTARWPPGICGGCPAADGPPGCSLPETGLSAAGCSCCPGGCSRCIACRGGLPAAGSSRTAARRAPPGGEPRGWALHIPRSGGGPAPRQAAPGPAAPRLQWWHRSVRVWPRRGSSPLPWHVLLRGWQKPSARLGLPAQSIPHRFGQGDLPTRGNMRHGCVVSDPVPVAPGAAGVTVFCSTERRHAMMRTVVGVAVVATGLALAGCDRDRSAEQRLDQMGESMEQGAERAGDSMRDATRQGADGARDAWDEGREGAREGWDRTQDAAEDAWDTTRERSGEAWDSTKEKAGEAWDTTKEKAREGKEKAREGGERAREKAGEARDSARDRLNRSGD